jgi:hypothetical protein
MSESTEGGTGLYSGRYVPPNASHAPPGANSGRPPVVAPPTSHELATAGRRLEARFDVLRADFEAHQAEAHPRPLPNIVGSLQAQWQVVPAPLKQVVLIYGAMAIFALTIRFCMWFLATFRRKADKEPEPIIMRQWPGQ